MPGDIEDEEYRPRPEDHLVEPFFAGLGQEGGGREVREDVRRGCGGAATLVVVASCLAALLA